MHRCVVGLGAVRAIALLYCFNRAIAAAWLDARPLHRSLGRQGRSHALAAAESRHAADGDCDLDNVAARIQAAVHSRPPPCATTTAQPLIFESTGGWGDQLRGMVTAFYVALMSCRPFQVHLARRFDLGAYFDERLDHASAGAASSGTRVAAVNDWQYFRNESSLRHIQALATSVTLQTNAYQWLDVVRHGAARPVAEHYGLAGRTQYELFSIAMRVLLPRPSRQVQESVSRMLDRDRGAVFGKRPRLVSAPVTTTQTIIGVQIRTGGGGEGWQDPPRHPLSSVACFADEARRVCGDANCTIFLTTDSHDAASEFKRLVDATPTRVVIEWEGDILHTSKSVRVTHNDTSPDPWMKTFLDWVTLSQVDVLLMSRSGFGWTAAWAGAVPYVREFAGGAAECGWTDFDKGGKLAY